MRNRRDPLAPHQLDQDLVGAQIERHDAARGALVLSLHGRGGNTRNDANANSGFQRGGEDMPPAPKAMAVYLH